MDSDLGPTSTIDAALARVRELPGLTVRHDPDAGVLMLESSAGRTRYDVEAKATPHARSLPAILDHLPGRDDRHRTLLVTDHLTPAVAERLVREGIEFADAAGNVYLNGPAAYVLVLGKKRRTVRSRKGLSPTDLTLAFALLARADIRTLTYRELAEAGGMSLGAVSNGINRLREAGYVRRPEGTIVLRRPMELLERWEYGYLEDLRPRLHPALFRLGKDASLESVAARAMRLEGVRIGGEVAADAWTQHLRPSTLTLHVPAGRTGEIARALRLPPAREVMDDAGVHVLERFAPHLDTDERRRPGPRRLIHPILVRAELLALDDARLRGVAERMLRDVVTPELKRGA